MLQPRVAIAVGSDLELARSLHDCAHEAIASAFVDARWVTRTVTDTLHPIKTTMAG